MNRGGLKWKETHAFWDATASASAGNPSPSHWTEVKRSLSLNCETLHGSSEVIVLQTMTELLPWPSPKAAARAPEAAEKLRLVHMPAAVMYQVYVLNVSVLLNAGEGLQEKS